MEKESQTNKSPRVLGVATQRCEFSWQKEEGLVLSGAEWSEERGDIRRSCGEDYMEP